MYCFPSCFRYKTVRSVTTTGQTSVVCVPVTWADTVMSASVVERAHRSETIDLPVLRKYHRSGFGICIGRVELILECCISLCK